MVSWSRCGGNWPVTNTPSDIARMQPATPSSWLVRRTISCSVSSSLCSTPSKRLRPRLPGPASVRSALRLMPGTPCKSSNDWNPPRALRDSMMRWAATGPTPSILASSSTVQELRRAKDEIGAVLDTGAVGGAVTCTSCTTSLAGASTTGAGVSATGAGVSAIIGAGPTTGVTVSATGAVVTGSTDVVIDSAVWTNTDGCSVTAGAASAIDSLDCFSTGADTSVTACTCATVGSMRGFGWSAGSAATGSMTAAFAAKMDRLSSSSVLDAISIGSGVVSAAIGAGTNSGCAGSVARTSTGSGVEDFSVNGVGISLSLKSISCNSEEFD